MAHLEDTKGDGIPPDTGGWGWRSATEGSGEFEHTTWKPQGARFGWICDDGLYLQPDTALKLAQDVGRDSSDPIALTKTTLEKRLRDKRLLLSTGKSEGRESIAVRRMFAGRRDAYFHVSKDYLSPVEEKPDQSDQNGQDSFRYGDSSGQVSPLDLTTPPESGQKPEHDDPDEGNLGQECGEEHGDNRRTRR